MITCKKCAHQMDESDSYCSVCGSLSYIVKENTKGRMVLSLDKIIPVGVILIISGIALNAVLFLFVQRIVPLGFGVGLAISILGITLVMTYKRAVEASQKNVAALNKSGNADICKYCNGMLEPEDKYCSHCGSRRR